MEQSIFMDKSLKPTDADLKDALGKSVVLWKEIRDKVFESYPGALEEWNYPGKKYGWSFRIKDKRRAIIYLLPKDNAFMAAFVFGGKAYEAIMDSAVSEKIKNELSEAKVYAEGRGIRIPVPGREVLKDIFHLMEIKLAY